MFMRGRVKPSKGASLLGMIVGAGFVIFGVTSVIPSAPGFFGILWVLVALGITITNGVNFFTGRGVSQWEVDVEPMPRVDSTQGPDFEARLRKLERLRQDRLITEEEYLKKRSEILKDQW
ncbi:SHOCT domain-containing protein [Paenibacillus silviterrae]|uniref:SHOCT domain-containing protein n=1 Tax=Paenibacillus silviterrae TaxID=3242194 RepID=UPI0025434DFD|nr:SHOCT domain-containing protein [Paenibacillus chinjuensis]